MKRSLVVIWVALMMCVSMYAQKFEVIREYPFDDFLQYYEEWPDDEGYGPAGIYYLQDISGKIYAFSMSSSNWFEAKNPYEIKEEYGNGYIRVFNNNKSCYFLRNGEIRIYLDDFVYENYDYLLKIEEGVYIKDYHTIYYTEDMIFFQTSDNKLISWKLLENGKSEYYNAKQTQEMLDSGLAKKLGYSIHNNDIYFGENCVSRDTAPYVKAQIPMTILDEEYKDFSVRKYGKGFRYLGTDKNGLSYFYYLNDPTQVTGLAERSGKPLVVNIVCADNFEKTFQTVATLPAGDWDPSRNAGGLIARCSQCIDEDGNVYFTDCNKEKGVYQIKKLTNTWSEELGYSKRIIGRVNANQIPLYKAKKTSAETNGYNYEHEFLWVLEKNESWCKVRKVDGREGYIETKYIDFN